MKTKVRVGDIVECEDAVGRIVAITKEWVILEDPTGSEYAVFYQKGGNLWIPLDQASWEQCWPERKTATIPQKRKSKNKSNY